MANTFAPFGFHPVSRKDGAAWTGNQTTRLISQTYTTPIYFGDVAVALNTGYVNVASDTTLTANIGIFAGSAFLDPTSGFWRWSKHWPGTALTRDAQAFILDDPDVVLRVQTTGSSAITLADIGLNITFLASSGNALSGLSTFAANASTAATTATFPFRIVGLPEPNIDPNTDNGSANNVIYVSFNNIFYQQRTGI
jgi:hypothetical protein